MARSVARPPIPNNREVRFMLCPREGGEVSRAAMIAGRPGGIKAWRRNGSGDGEPGRGGGLGDAAGGERPGPPAGSVGKRIWQGKGSVLSPPTEGPEQAGPNPA